MNEAGLIYMFSLVIGMSILAFGVIYFDEHPRKKKLKHR
jgi:hypothetical protein